MLNEKEMSKMGYVLCSKHRENIIKNLYKNKLQIPSKIAKETNILPNHISFYLRQLKENDIVKCINEEDHKGRLYKLTDMGFKIAKELEE